MTQGPAFSTFCGKLKGYLTQGLASPLVADLGVGLTWLEKRLTCDRRGVPGFGLLAWLDVGMGLWGIVNRDRG